MPSNFYQIGHMRKKQTCRKRKILSNNDIQAFCQSYQQCHLIYHTRIGSEAKDMAIAPISEMRLFEHAFVKLPSADIRTLPITCQTAINQTLFQTFNKSDFTISNEETEYSSYLKEYQTVIKESRRKQYVSPLKQQKQMNLLINEFLINLNDTNSHLSNNPKSKNIGKTVDQENVEKNFLGHQSNIKREFSKTQNRGKQQKRLSIEERQQSPQFKPIQEMKIKQKKQHNSKSKQKIQIQVKVKDIRPRAEQKREIIPKSHLAIPKHIHKSLVPLEYNANLELTKDAYSHSHIKKKLKNEQKIHPIHIHSEKLDKNKKEAPSIKKPMKIQIQLSQQVFDDDAKSYQKSEEIQLDLERDKLIQVISQKIYLLLQKSNVLNEFGK